MSHPTPADGIALTLAEVEDLTSRALSASGVSPANLGPLVASVVAAEADGIHSHGLARLPTYCEHARCGKIDGAATPTLDQPRPGLVRVDAREGFAHPAIELGLPALIAAAKAQGIAALAVTNSYNCGVVGHHVERIAEAGLLALGFVNAPASMAPFGGNTPVFGTNPIAFAVPRADAPPLVLDQSASVVAKSELIVHQQRGQPIPEGWALDKDGNLLSFPGAPGVGMNWIQAPAAGGQVGARVVDGRPPETADELMMDPATVTRGGYVLGDTVEVSTPRSGLKSYTLVGTGTYGAGATAGASYLFFTLDEAQEIVQDGAEGFYAAWVVTEPGADPATVADAVEAGLPEGFIAETGDDLAAEIEEQLDVGLGFVNTFLLVFAGIALLVATLLILNTFSILVAQR
ncbi:MAG: hypothetical protein B7Z14_19105, partial [Bosea sp. 32-68-6]